MPKLLHSCIISRYKQKTKIGLIIKVFFFTVLTLATAVFSMFTIEHCLPICRFLNFSGSCFTPSRHRLSRRPLSSYSSKLGPFYTTVPLLCLPSLPCLLIARPRFSGLLRKSLLSRTNTHYLSFFANAPAHCHEPFPLVRKNPFHYKHDYLLFLRQRCFFIPRPL